MKWQQVLNGEELSALLIMNAHNFGFSRLVHSVNWSDYVCVYVFII